MLDKRQENFKASLDMITHEHPFKVTSWPFWTVGYGDENAMVDIEKAKDFITIAKKHSGTEVDPEGALLDMLIGYKKFVTMGVLPKHLKYVTPLTCRNVVDYSAERQRVAEELEALFAIIARIKVNVKYSSDDVITIGADKTEYKLVTKVPVKYLPNSNGSLYLLAAHLVNLVRLQVVDGSVKVPSVLKEPVMGMLDHLSSLVQ